MSPGPQKEVNAWFATVRSCRYRCVYLSAHQLIAGSSGKRQERQESLSAWMPAVGQGRYAGKECSGRVCVCKGVTRGCREMMGMDCNHLPFFCCCLATHDSFPGPGAPHRPDIFRKTAHLSSMRPADPLLVSRDLSAPLSGICTLVVRSVVH